MRAVLPGPGPAVSPKSYDLGIAGFHALCETSGVISEGGRSNGRRRNRSNKAWQKGQKTVAYGTRGARENRRIARARGRSQCTFECCQTTAFGRSAIQKNGKEREVARLFERIPCSSPAGIRVAVFVAR